MMKGAFNRAVSYALFSKNPDKRLFKSSLYKRFTYKGANRKLIYRPSINNPKTYKKTQEYNWGNYVSYVYKADDSMETINGNKVIRRQARKLWRQFHLLLKTSEEKLCQNPEPPSQ